MSSVRPSQYDQPSDLSGSDLDSLYRTGTEDHVGSSSAVSGLPMSARATSIRARDASKPTRPPLEVLFEKPDIASPMISPKGKYHVWLQRDSERKVLNFFVHDKLLTHPRQVTYFADRDAAKWYKISADDKYIIFWREAEPGEEMYHIYTVDVSNVNEITEKTWSYKARCTNLKKTYVAGFVGGNQLFVSNEMPNKVVMAEGSGGLFWDLVELDLEENTLTTIFRHPGLHWSEPLFLFGWLLIDTLPRLILNIVTSYLYLIYGWWFVFEAATFPTEWFVNPATLRPQGQIAVGIEVPILDPSRIGIIRFLLSRLGLFMKAGESSLTIKQFLKQYIPPPQIHCYWKFKHRRTWKTLHKVPMGKLNMNLVGAAPGTGLFRMDFVDDETVDCHICRAGEPFTSYERFELRKNKLTSRKLFKNELNADVGGFLRSYGKSVDALIVERERQRICVINDNGKSYEDMQKAFRRSIIAPQSKVSLIPISRTYDDRKWIVFGDSDRGFCSLCEGAPEAYFEYDKKKQTVKVLAIPRPKLSHYCLAQRTSLTIKTRDGQDMLVYLTLPRRLTDDMRQRYNSGHRWDSVGSFPKTSDGGRTTLTTEPSMKSFDIDGPQFPLIIMPHGGPLFRDYGGYDQVAQFLGTRGFIVLQPQYRGSAGFGLDWENAGYYGEFCRTMQRDIVDAVHYCIDELKIGVTADGQDLEIISDKSKSSIKSRVSQDPNAFFEYAGVDTNKICMLGGSWGGYCTLFGMTLLDTTDAKFNYCCGVAYAALYEVGYEAAGKGFRNDALVAQYWRKVYGDVISDNQEESVKWSPGFHAEKVRVPMLISHGAKDPRCPCNVADAFCAELAKKKLVRYIKYEEEGHGYKNEANSLHFWREVERFLCGRLLNQRLDKVIIPEDTTANVVYDFDDVSVDHISTTSSTEAVAT